MLFQRRVVLVIYHGSLEVIMSAVFRRHAVISIANDDGWKFPSENLLYEYVRGKIALECFMSLK